MAQLGSLSQQVLLTVAKYLGSFPTQMWRASRPLRCLMLWGTFREQGEGCDYRENTNFVLFTGLSVISSLGNIHEDHNMFDPALSEDHLFSFPVGWIILAIFNFYFRVTMYISFRNPVLNIANATDKSCGWSTRIPSKRLNKLDFKGGVCDLANTGQGFTFRQ